MLTSLLTLLSFTNVLIVHFLTFYHNLDCNHCFIHWSVLTPDELIYIYIIITISEEGIQLYQSHQNRVWDYFHLFWE